MISVVLRAIFLMQRGNRISHEVDVYNVNLVIRTKRKHRQSSQEHKRFDHVELGSLRATAIAEHDARTKNRKRHFRQKLPDHVLAKLFCPGIRIVIRPLPIDRLILRDYFILTFAGHSHRTDMAKAAEPMIVVHPHGKLQDFQRSSQVHVKATLLRLTIQRCRTMNDRIRRMDQSIVIIPGEAKLRLSEITAKNPNPSLQLLVEAREIEMQLQGM